MSITEAHARIKSRVWQSIAQTDLDISALEKETIESLVDLVTEASLLELDEVMGNSLKTEQLSQLEQDLNDEDEDLLWEGRPFLSITLHYRITDERILITQGLFGKVTENIELIRIQDMAHSQSFGERLINVGDITVRSHDSSNPIFYLKNIKNPADVHEILRRAVLVARKKHNFTYREEM
ncbi:MAG: PH domain-containing protein [Chloroflexi bacterium]|nr:MAG: PH domain-containing protein [Chloroflexota bacterium]